MGFLVKLLLKAGITLGVMFIGYKYILTGGSGGFQIPDMSAITAQAPKGVSGLGNAVVQKDITVYQWVDSDGITHFGGTQPTGQGAYTKKEIHANTNLLNAYKAPKKETRKSDNKSRVARVGSLYSPEGIKNLMDDTKNTSKQAENRMSEQEKLLNDLMGEGGLKK